MGGRGASSSGGGGGGKMSFSNGKWSSNAAGFQNHDTLKEALGTKGSPKTMGDAVLHTNPSYSGNYKEFSENCQRVVVAYEARRRGYNVTAQATYKGDTLNQIAYYDAKNGVDRGRWMGAFQNAKPVNVSAKTSAGVISNIDSQMASFGDGARGVVQIFYKSGGGHVFNVERQNGKTIYIEAQAGRMKNIGRTMNSVVTDSVALVRTDNLKFSDRAKNFVTTRK
jgi:hypothetical protein